MYPARATRELGILLRISRELDIVGDLTAVVDNPSELLAWANTLTNPAVTAWRANGSGACYVQVSAAHTREPVHGHITALMYCDQHPEFWHELTHDHAPDSGTKYPLTPADLSRAWQAMPITPPN